MRRGHQGLGTRWDAVLSFWPPWTLQELRIQIFSAGKSQANRLKKSLAVIPGLLKPMAQKPASQSLIFVRKMSLFVLLINSCPF